MCYLTYSFCANAHLLNKQYRYCRKTRTRNAQFESSAIPLAPLFQASITPNHRAGDNLLQHLMVPALTQEQSKGDVVMGGIDQPQTRPPCDVSAVSNNHATPQAHSGVSSGVDQLLRSLVTPSVAQNQTTVFPNIRTANALLDHNTIPTTRDRKPRHCPIEQTAIIYSLPSGGDSGNSLRETVEARYPPDIRAKSFDVWYMFSQHGDERYSQDKACAVCQKAEVDDIAGCLGAMDVDKQKAPVAGEGLGEVDMEMCGGVDGEDSGGTGFLVKSRTSRFSCMF